MPANFAKFGDSSSHFFFTVWTHTIVVKKHVLFSPLGKLAGSAIYFACVNFFLFYLILVIARRTTISGSTGPIFAFFSPNESVLGADNRSGTFF